ncbi:TetR/AcrR family transcriptional regulator [Streptomonospora arabica]|uniref:TetR/AcrR family transcriptional regulator n=1 Tax=Streptomonospora arabica TaxID=412417 RepID=A0ABV9STH8_9ACTN
MMEQSNEDARRVPPGLVDAAVAAARERGRDVAEVPLTAIAAKANISRSTLLRRLGGTRAALDAAVLASGVDPGGRPPVRERAVAAAAEIIGDRGLGGVTLDAVAAAAQCSVPSLHTVFHGRDGLLSAVFERYGPVIGIEAVAEDPPERFEDVVHSLFRAIVTAFSKEPRVLPAIVADLLGRPDGPGSRLLEAAVPRLLHGMTSLFAAEIEAGRLRPLPMPVIIQLLIGPPAVHMMVRPALDRALGPALPSVDDACAMFADGFLRAVAPDPSTAEGGPRAPGGTGPREGA